MKVKFEAYRPSTKSLIRGEIPTEIGGNEFDWNQWIGEHYDWQFIPIDYYYENQERRREKPM